MAKLISSTYRRVVVYLANDDETYHRLRAVAGRQRKRISQLAGEYIRQGLEREQKEETK
mgnify:CR=1 FL=1